MSLVATAGRKPGAMIPWGRTRDAIRHAVDVDGPLTDGDRVLTVCGATLLAFSVGPAWADDTGRHCQRCTAKTTTSFLHMAATRPDLELREWTWDCRCGDSGSWWPTQNAARLEGDAHLREANGATT